LDQSGKSKLRAITPVRALARTVRIGGDMKRYLAVIFDVDGTLVDSNDVHAETWVEVFAELGFRVPYEHVRRMIGMGGDKLIPAALQVRDDDPRVEQINARRSERFLARGLARVRALPGSRELARALARRGYRLGVASSAKREELEPLLEIAGVADLIEVETSSSDAERSKPDPDIVAAALRRLDVPAEHVVMIGDTPYDLEAAARAGIDLIAFRSGGWDDASLARAIAIHDGPEDLLRHLDDSPLATVHGMHRPR
jgi:HAD superfamily hydrolase (TIGR01509 family)